MKAIVVTDQAAGTAGMMLKERPEPQAAINDVIVQIHASGYVPTEPSRFLARMFMVVLDFVPMVVRIEGPRFSIFVYIKNANSSLRFRLAGRRSRPGQAGSTA